MAREQKESTPYGIDTRDTEPPSFLTLLRRDPMVLVWTAVLLTLARFYLWAEGCPKPQKSPKNT